MFTLKFAILAPIVLIALYILFPVSVAAITAPFTKRPKVKVTFRPFNRW